MIDNITKADHRPHYSTPLQLKKAADAECQRLQARLWALKKENTLLEMKREHLQSSVSDLQQLVKGVSSENLEEVCLLREENSSLEEQKAALHVSLRCNY